MSKLKFDINSFRTDKEAKASGVWIDFGGDAEFLIASFDTPAFTEAFRKAIKPYTDLSQDVPEEDQTAIMCACMAQHVVLDWKGVYDGDNELPYNLENAIRVLTELEPIRERVLTESRKLSNFRAKAREEVAKN